MVTKTSLLRKTIVLLTFIYILPSYAQQVTPADIAPLMPSQSQTFGGNSLSKPSFNLNQAREMLQQAPGGLSQGKSLPSETKTNNIGAIEPQSKDSPSTKSLTAKKSTKPSNFQIYVKQLTDKEIPIFGQELFDGYDSFAALESQPVPAEYVIGPGDEITLKIIGNDFDFDQRLVVDRSGLITIPKIGPVSVAGVKVKDIEPFLKTRLSKMFDGFSLHVGMGRLRGIEIYVVGHARSPGRYIVSSVSSLINALFATGGPDANGTMRNIELIRNNNLVTSLDLYDFIRSGSTKSDVRLMPGDIIKIPASGPTIALMGVVPTEAIFELKQHSAMPTLDEVLSLAGGRPVVSSPLSITLKRIDPFQSKPLSVIHVTADTVGLNTSLKDGDVVFINPLKPAFDNAITLRILDAVPVRIPIGTNTKISDTIPNRDVLLTPEYWQRRFNPSTQNQTERAFDSMVERLRAQSRLDQINWEQAIIERVDPLTLATQIISFSLDKAINLRDPKEDKVLQPGDVITIFSQNSIAVPQEKRVQLVQLEGEVRNPGVYQLLPGETLDKLIERAGGVTSSAYLYGTELKRASIRAQQRKNIDALVKRLESQLEYENIATAELAPDAARLMQINQLRAREQVAKLRQAVPTGRLALEMSFFSPAIPAIQLEDGDEIRVPQFPSSVSAVGAVYNENALLYRKGRKVSEYLKVAGISEWAEIDKAFIARADGTVTNGNEDRFFLFRGGIDSLELFPGDTVVVPEKPVKESTYSIVLRGLKDWTQVLYQLGLTAAAINTLK